MSERIIIVGGGVSGLLASYVLCSYGQTPVILEPQKVGGDFLLGGLKYIHRTDRMAELFDAIELPWSEYKVRGGILLRGQVQPYPKCLHGMVATEANRIRADHFRKTRHVEPGGDFAAKAMNDPAAAKGPRRAMRTDFQYMIDELEKRAKIIRLGLSRIDSARNAIQLSNGEWCGYDKLILTIPLWVIRSMADFYVPQGMALGLNLIQVRPMRDAYSKWDYVYTPYTPADAIHRISHFDGGYTCEANGGWSKQESNVQTDLAFIFEDGFLIESIKAGVKGHLLELQEQPRWPDNVAPLGRFAKWDPRATADVTLEDVRTLAEAWGWTETL